MVVRRNIGGHWVFGRFSEFIVASRVNIVLVLKQLKSIVLSTRLIPTSWGPDKSRIIHIYLIITCIVYMMGMRPVVSL